MSIEDTIKSLEEADEKLQKAVVLESEAVAMQKDAAKLRDESRDNLHKTVIERDKMNAARIAWDSESSRKEQELKNREVTLTAGQSDLERNTAEGNKNFDTRHAALDARTVAADKADRRNKEFAETLDNRAEKYKSIGDFITTTL